MNEHTQPYCAGVRTVPTIARDVRHDAVTTNDADDDAESWPPPPVMTAPAPVLTLYSTTRDALAESLVQELDAQIDAPAPFVPTGEPVAMGELQELGDWAASGVTLFRYVTAALGLPATVHLPTRLLTPRARGKLYDFVEALEAEAARQAEG
jgi:hypothetical protein